MATRVQQHSEIKIKKLHPKIGAEVTGFDLRLPFDDEIIQIIKEAWYKHTVLLFRNQQLSEDEQLRFASLFGPIADRVQPPRNKNYSDAADWGKLMLVTDHVSEDGKPLGSLGHGEMTFHTDKCYRERPHHASFLYGIEIPDTGGNTKFASLYAAYNSMPQSLKKRLKNSFVMQGHQYGGYGRLDLDVDLADIHHFRQPMIVKNPGSGMPALYISRLNTMWIEGIDRRESEALLEQLFDLTEDPRNMYEHVWRQGDLLMWDNLACLHARTDWPKDQKRALRRCTTEGERLW